MTLARLKAEHRRMFCPQDWYDAEDFMQIRLREPLPDFPSDVEPCADPDGMAGLPHAVELADLYVRWPEHPAFSDYVWTCDFDKHGQRVFVGGTANGRGFEIHRHLRITKRWGVASWE